MIEPGKKQLPSYGWHQTKFERISVERAEEVPTLSESWNEFIDVTWTQPIIRPTIRLVTRALAAIARML